MSKSTFILPQTCSSVNALNKHVAGNLWLSMLAQLVNNIATLASFYFLWCSTLILVKPNSRCGTCPESLHVKYFPFILLLYWVTTKVLVPKDSNVISGILGLVCCATNTERAMVQVFLGSYWSFGMTMHNSKHDWSGYSEGNESVTLLHRNLCFR